MNRKRIRKIEIALPPKPAVVRWVRRRVQNQTSLEYARWLVVQPVSKAPRVGISKQVLRAVHEAMKGQDERRILKAARKAHMETDSLILIVTKANDFLRDESNLFWLRFAGFNLRILALTLSGEDDPDDLMDDLREAAIALFGVQLAIEQIQNEYFDGECILHKDASEDLKRDTWILRWFIEGADQTLAEKGHGELGLNLDSLRGAIRERADKKEGYIVALARSIMLEHFGKADAANAELRPYVLGDPVK